MASKKIGLQQNNPPIFKLGFKIVPRKEFLITDNVKLECTTDSHNKYYHMTIQHQGNSPLTNYTLLVEYGRIGNSPGTKKHGTQYLAGARKLLQTKLRSQLKKGYVIVTEKTIGGKKIKL